jgi:hypothetical protein
MRRREFIAGLVSLAALPITAGVQQPAVPETGLARKRLPMTVFSNSQEVSRA